MSLRWKLLTYLLHTKTLWTQWRRRKGFAPIATRNQISLPSSHEQHFHCRICNVENLNSQIIICKRGNPEIRLNYLICPIFKDREVLACLPLKDGTDSLSRKFGIYRPTLYKVPEERRPQLNRGWTLKSRILTFTFPCPGRSLFIFNTHQVFSLCLCVSL